MGRIDAVRRARDPAVIGIGLVTFLIMRRWILAAFVVFVVAVESATSARRR